VNSTVSPTQIQIEGLPKPASPTTIGTENLPSPAKAPKEKPVSLKANLTAT
jgi:hypothetical protein